jgi:Leucine-rich repeat (LRR) protein
MSNPLNPIQSQPVSLVKQITSFMITRDLQNSHMTNHVRVVVNDSFTRAWLDLKNSPQNFNLEHIMSNIERSFVESEQQNRKITFLPEQVNDVLQKNRDILFKKLAETFQAKRVFGNHIPVDISSYERLQKVLEDRALQNIWNSHLKKLFVFNGPVPTSPNQIKAWLKNPANAMQLNGVQGLDLSGLRLKAIPPELSTLTGLQWLSVADNQISSIPNSLANLTQLQVLNLADNQIYSIPDFFAGFSQLQGLYLENNQISNIPDSLGDLPQLQKLSLENNQISRIPDSLSKLPQLQNLNLANNQINSIPDSLGNLPLLQSLNLDNNRINSIPNSLAYLSQLQELFLQNNQISNISDSFSKLSQLRWLYLRHNQISNIPDSFGNLSQLEVLSLENNQMSTIPDSLIKLLPQLQSFALNGNPLLFIDDKNPVSSDTLKIVTRYSEFKEYKCLSSFSNLCQLIVLKNDNHEAIKEAFGNLKKNDQNLIFEMVYKVSGVHSKEDPIWGEHHVFDDMNIFYHAVKKAIAAKFDRLSLKEKNAVYGEIYQLAQPKTEDPKWGLHHAFDNILRLVDAMDRIE